MAHKAKMMLFSHVSNTRSITGAEKLLLFFCRKLSSYFDVMLVAPQEGQITLLAQQAGIRTCIHAYPLFHEIYTPHAHLFKDAEKHKMSLACQTLAELIRIEAPDVVLTNTCVNVLPAMAASSLGIPVLWSITESMVVNEYTPLSVALIDRYSDWITGISVSALSAFANLPVPEKISLIYPSWDTEEIHPEYWELLREQKRSEFKLLPDQRCIGYISAFLTRDKGLRDFVDMALALLPSDPSLRFLIIGRIVDRDFYTECLSRINASGHAAKFQFVVFEPSVEAVYCAMDLIVVPSLVPEGFGLTAMEAMAHGKPVAAYGSGGLREILEAVGSTEMLAEPRDYKDLTAKIKAQLTDPQSLADIGRRNRIRVHEIFGTTAYEQRLKRTVESWVAYRPDLLQLAEDEGRIVAVSHRPHILSISTPTAPLEQSSPILPLHHPRTRRRKRNASRTSIRSRNLRPRKRKIPTTRRRKIKLYPRSSSASRRASKHRGARRKARTMKS
ncbi:glycosyltransferase involved in cell wall biosynthesis [Paenibacillus shirakamiensis]|uniref:Glycosyltransferase involved in cell wall biosynthesis n=1 Tax=Paenibacillus shirakamiensis TaxID=1265935 RepID=A0ABS4JMC3_9BACL|nr:glycosyltransferase [Paenibacillus shirakamiensis]MBP2002136.1 glycosyltransferase involved in cell wall biosynthesis [Paenibacillus shirakamiensis]